MGKTAQYLQPRREQAAERNALYAALTTQQKIDSLDARLGKGVGAAKQRARLARELAGNSKPAKKEAIEAVLKTDAPVRKSEAKGKVKLTKERLIELIRSHVSPERIVELQKARKMR